MTYRIVIPTDRRAVERVPFEAALAIHEHLYQVAADPDVAHAHACERIARVGKFLAAYVVESSTQSVRLVRVESGH